MKIGFSVIGRGPEVEFRLFGQRESDPPSLISFARMPDLWAVLLGRLYYRRELLAYLGSPSSEDARFNTRAVLASY